MGVFLPDILKRYSVKTGDFATSLQKILGFWPNHLMFYKRAFTHRSFNEKDENGNALNYERLEFLGDAILGAVVAGFLFEELPKSDEGQLTEMRSKLVSRRQLNQIGRELKLVQLMNTEFDLDRFGENIHGNLIEALIGAIYKDKGFETCKKFITQKIIKDNFTIHQLQNTIISYKSWIIEWCQKEKIPFNFESYATPQLDAAAPFSAKLRIGNEIISQAHAPSKKKAEEKAAETGYKRLYNKTRLNAER